MSFSTFFSEQARQPSGLFGRIVKENYGVKKITGSKLE